MNEDDQDKNNIESKEEEVKREENQSQGESSPNEAQPSESSTPSAENKENQPETQSGVEERKNTK